MARKKPIIFRQGMKLPSPLLGTHAKDRRIQRRKPAICQILQDALEVVDRRGRLSTDDVEEIEQLSQELEMESGFFLTGAGTSKKDILDSITRVSMEIGGCSRG